jgi:dephospho-CoA kinase
MGKTQTARLFMQEGVPVYDADAEVHRLYDKGGAAVSLIAAAFPGAVKNGVVERDRLSKIVLQNKAALARLEAIVHPMVQACREDAIKHAQSKGAELMVLDIPLLFEKGGESEVDCIVVVSAPHHIQRARVLERAGMTKDKLDSILQQQIPDAQKRRRADYIVETDKGIEYARAQVRHIIQSIKSKSDSKDDDSL